MNAICRAMVEIECEAAPEDVVPGFLAGAVPENELTFYQRRAMEESVAAQRARCPQAAAAHRYLANVYAGQIRRELDAIARFEDLLERLD